MSIDRLENRFEVLQRAFASCGDNRLADAPLETWARHSDRHLPSTLMQCSLRDILQTPFRRLAQTRGVGQTKLERLVQIVERALHALLDADARKLVLSQSDEAPDDDRRSFCVPTSQTALSENF